MKRAFLRFAIGLFVVALVAPAELAGQRGKIINVSPTKPKTPPKIELADRYDGNATQLKKYEAESGTLSITKTTAPLTWKAIPDDPDLAELPVPGKRARELRRYELADGAITIEYTGRTVNKIFKCDVHDTRTFKVKELPQAVLQGAVLTVGSDGTYQLDLNLSAIELQWTAMADCVTMSGKTFKTKVLVGEHAFALGHQQGPIEYGVHGDTKSPRTQGEYKITGTWNFAAVKDR